jgi:hypothetical protein
LLVTLPSIRLTLGLSILSRHLVVGAALYSVPTMTEAPDFELMKNAEGGPHTLIYASYH